MVTRINELIVGHGEWLRDDGPEGDVVVSSRVRLARNLARFRFSPRMSDTEKTAVADLIQYHLPRFRDGRLSYLDLESLDPLDRQVLVERRLISREHDEGAGSRGVAFDATESLAIMVNEEDHLRMQALRSGLQLAAAYQDVDQLDDEAAKVLDFAYDDDFGFLTACPTNVGSGMRISVMLHLPGLAMTRYLDRAFRAAHDLRLAVRGLNGEGSEAEGDLYQVSNQLTIGQTDAQIMAGLSEVITEMIAFERRARERLREKNGRLLEDRIWRAHAVLGQARMISSGEALTHISSVRLGIKLGIVSDVNIGRLNQVFLYSLPGHLQLLEGRQLDVADRDEARARLIRAAFSAPSDPDAECN